MKFNFLALRALMMGLVAFLALGSIGWAFHLRLTGSIPAADSSVPESPGTITLEFSQKPTVAVSRIGLSGPGGELELERPRTGSDTLSLVVDVGQGLVPGSYTVSWRTTGNDGHVRRGEFSFAVAAPDK